MLLSARARAVGALVAALTARARRAAPSLRSVLTFRVWPTDVDLNLHLTNSRYPQLMDVGRLDLLLRSGVLDAMLREGTRPVAVDVRIQFKRELAPGQRFTLATEAVARRGRAVEIRQTFRIGDVEHAVGTVTVLAVRGGRAVAPGALLDLLAPSEAGREGPEVIPDP